MKFDIFICHAHEDKAHVADPLYRQLIRRGVRVWIDEFQLAPGDSIRRKIDLGLKDSRMGVVILSKHFFQRKWTNYELDGLLGKERGRHHAIIPVWHKIGYKQVAKYSESLAMRMALDTQLGIAPIAGRIAAHLLKQLPKSSRLVSRSRKKNQPASLKNQLIPGFKPKILVIDDDPKVNWILAEGLSEEFEFLKARDGAEGLTTITCEQPDLVLLDLKMPGLNGLQVLKELRKRKEKIDVIMLSGHGTTPDIVDAVKLGAIDWVDKPFDVREIRMRLWFAIRNRLPSED